MKLSVILPYYNGMPFLKHAITSLLNQTFQDFIIYAIDNGSTDGSEEYLTTLNEKKIRHIRIEEKNLVKALNKGLELSDTPLIARMDSDDLCHPDRFQKQINFLDRNQNISLVGSLGRYIGVDNKKYFNINVPLKHDEIIETMLRSRNAIIHPSIMFRRKVYDDFGGYTEQYPDCEDYEYFLRIGNKIQFANLSERLHFMRIGEGSVITENIARSLTQYYFISAKYSQNYPDSNKTQKHPEDFYLNFFKKLDVAAMSAYRKGLNYYLNKNVVLGISCFIIASIFNPFRFFNAIRRRLFYSHI